MQMIGHQAEGMHRVAKADDPFGQQVIEIPAIGGGEEHLLPGVAAQNYVVKTAGDVQSQSIGRINGLL